MRLLLKYDSKTVKRPLLSSAALKTGALINILRAFVESRKGEILIEVPDEKAKEVEDFLISEGVSVLELKRGVTVDENCVHCGLCISVCPTEAINFDEERKILVFEERCIHCEICVKVCPVSALKLPEV
ncbi:MAG: 4Fe-4S dicluster domain-containing protein [Archaeoglobaceae archaeon]|nr:4Fe-4S dicluster domain-containing protein [Archaeoglobaceae archaeon]MCX8151887.1 4Fe-4S dicluster domain-containing protein [Archaeoglobaceae archaeon]MDW8013276.1 4Fe-4S dicluster domain-containing protein [Archaeoglobaceae archaeon]